MIHMDYCGSVLAVPTIGICLNNTKKYSFPLRSIDILNRLREGMIMAKNVQQLREKLEKYK